MTQLCQHSKSKQKATDWGWVGCGRQKIRLLNVPVADLGLRKCSEAVASAATGLDVSEATYRAAEFDAKPPTAGIRTQRRSSIFEVCGPATSLPRYCSKIVGGVARELAKKREVYMAEYRHVQTGLRHMPHICTSKLPVYLEEDIHYVVVTQGTLVIAGWSRRFSGWWRFVLASFSIRRTPLTTKDFSFSPLFSFSFPRHQFQRTPHLVISQYTEAPPFPSPSPNLPEVRLQPSCQLQKFPPPPAIN